MIKSFLALMLLILCLSAYALQDRYVFQTQAQERQFTQLTAELRCLVCQNESLEASNAPLANDIKAKIYEMIQEGQSNEAIIEYLTSRYGDFINFNPPLTPRTYWLWFGPFVLLLLGFYILFNLIKKSRSS